MVTGRQVDTLLVRSFMAQRVPAFHSLHQQVYHTTNGCVYGLGIEPSERVAGPGGRVECLLCQQLNRAADQRLSWRQYLKRLLGRWTKRKG